jgi:hypothetical protein
MAEGRLPPVNLIIRDTLRARLAALSPASELVAEPAGGAANSVPPPPPVLALSLTEFDDVRYLLTAEAETPALVSLSLALPSDPSGARGAAALPEGAADAARATYAPYATVAPQPVAGYHLTLLVDLAAMPGDVEGREAEAERVASVRAVVQGAPLRALLAALAAGTAAPDTLVAIPHRRVHAAASRLRCGTCLRSRRNPRSHSALPAPAAAASHAARACARRQARRGVLRQAQRRGRGHGGLPDAL